MRIEDIPQEKWIECIDELNKQNGRLFFSIEVAKEHFEKKIIAENLLLKELTINVEQGGFNNNSIIVGEKLDEVVNHFIPNINKIAVEKSDNGTLTALHFSSEKKSDTTIHFRK